MELQSLELANRELEEQIQHLRSTLEKKSSLGSISSDDRICLGKIRELGEIKAHKKRKIQELEEKETLLRCLIEKILGPKPIKQKRLCDLLKNNSKHHIYRSKNHKIKDPQKIDKSRQRQVNKHICFNLGNDTLKRMVNHNPMACKCYDKCRSPNLKELYVDKDLAGICSCRQENAKNCNVNELCKCGKYLLQESQTECSDAQEDPRCSFL
ncbi:uncharacterized protein LOC131667509 [Phymastichus coffea]|uniref:uncharacterized protein LOC131667509 n=1 Tax=Phymastichus coffea TaxID=108790 RepID=UPI00273C4F07|nr:uncharacterized protein LOC131667509 [Phymastichus coffea]XP_058796943.1 uncharacterized protein LOC131667509 [Phymastichus coffea]